MERRSFYHKPFGESSRRGETGSRETQVVKRAPQEQQWYEQDIPYEQLVATLKYLRARENARWGTPLHRFPTAEWLADELNTQAERSANSGAPIEEQTFFHELKIAWHAVAYPQFGRSLSGIARKQTAEYIQTTGSTSVTLRPKAAKLFDAMAEVAEIPRTRGQTTVDLTPIVKRSATTIISFE
jgi:hypothetical protein